MPATSSSLPAPSRCNGLLARCVSVHWKSSRYKRAALAKASATTERADDLHTVVGGHRRLQRSHHRLANEHGDMATDSALLVDHPESHAPITPLQLINDIGQHQRPVGRYRQLQDQFALAVGVVIQLAGKHDTDHGVITTSTE